MSFPGQFSQIGFSCYLVWKHSKNPMGHISGVAEPFFLKISQCDKFWIFLPFWQNMLLVWLTNNNKYSGALWKRCLKVNKLKDLIFFNFWPVFWPFFTGFLAFQKNLGQKKWLKLFFLTLPGFQLGFLNKVGGFFGFYINFFMGRISWRSLGLIILP